MDWEGEVNDREDLLIARMRQLDERSLEIARAAKELERSRKGNKAHFDQHKRMRGELQQLHVSDLVLVHQSKNLNSQSVKNKIDDRWFGPYWIREIPPDSTFYKLEELDGTHLKATFTGNCLKCFFTHVELDDDRAEQHEVIRVLDIMEDAAADVPTVDDLEEDLGVEED